MIVGEGSNPLVWTLPGKELERSANVIENFTVRLGEDGDPISFCSSVKKALGKPLFSNALVEVLHPTMATGPIVTARETRWKPDQKTEPEDEKQEEPSLLRKYWWVILGIVLISSLTGAGEPPGQAPAPASSSNNNST